MENISDDTIIITFTDFKYMDIFNIFYHNFKKLNINNLLVISLDEETYINLTERNINSIYKPYNIKIKNNFWEFRLNVINEIFKNSKKNIIHTDSDCFWFKNIYNEINSLKNNYDIIGSIAFGFPIEIVKKMGFVLCCGFYFIKYTEKNCEFFDKINNQNISSVNDQILFNNYLYNNKINIIENKYNQNNIICKIILLNDNTKIGIISDNVISRNYKKNLYCFHPFLSSKNMNDKLLQLKQHFYENFIQKNNNIKIKNIIYYK